MNIQELLDLRAPEHFLMACRFEMFSLFTHDPLFEHMFEVNTLNMCYSFFVQTVVSMSCSKCLIALLSFD